MIFLPFIYAVFAENMCCLCPERAINQQQKLCLIFCKSDINSRIEVFWNFCEKKIVVELPFYSFFEICHD